MHYSWFELKWRRSNFWSLEYTSLREGGSKNECETENERKNARKITVFRAKVGAFRAFSILFIYPGRFADVSSQNRKCRGVKATRE